MSSASWKADADVLAVRRERVLDLAGRAGEPGAVAARRSRSASRSCRRPRAGSARAGRRRRPGATVSRIWPSTSRVKVCAWMRTASGPRSAVSSEDLENRKSPVRIATWLSQRALAESAPRRSVGLVHHVVVVERGQVGQLDHAGRGDHLVGVGVRTGLRGQQHQQRPEPLAAGVQQVPGGLGDEVGLAPHVAAGARPRPRPSGRAAGSASASSRIGQGEAGGGAGVAHLMNSPACAGQVEHRPGHDAQEQRRGDTRRRWSRR